MLYMVAVWQKSGIYIPVNISSVCVGGGGGGGGGGHTNMAL